MPRHDAARLAAWSGGVWSPAPPAVIGGVCHDTRALREGDLYVALKGARFDGHAFVAEAFAKGACGAVVARSKAGAAWRGPLLLVDEPGAALRAMASGHRNGINAPIIGVTGSAGKTTAKEMIAAALSAAMPTARTLGNWNNEVGLPLSLLAMGQDSGAGVFEVGMNHPGETAALCRLLRPTRGVVTNVGPVHIGFFGTVEAIAGEKADLLRCLPSDGAAVLWKESQCFGLLREAAACRTVTVTMTLGPADYACVSRDAGAGRAVIEERATGHREQLALRLPGEHNVVNAMMAAAVARGLGVPWELVRPALEACGPLAMRWQEESLGGATLINDAYNANPLSVRAALRTFAERPVRGRRFLVLAGMLELGDHARAEHEAVGRCAAELGADGLLAVGELGGMIADGARLGGLPEDRVLRCADTAAAARSLAERLGDGDAVLLKGSRGMRLEEVIAELRKLRGVAA